MTKRSTKSALLSAILALVICFTALVGTTFAWFTDSVTSANNKIVAGNLDLDLYLWGANGSTEITENSAPLFGSTTGLAQNDAADTLWEPGKTQVVYLSIKNNGSLDLKYSVALTVKNPEGGKDLYKVLSYDIIENARVGEATAWANGVSVLPGTNTTQAVDVPLLADEEHFFALAIHMDEAAGNEYKEGSVEFDVLVLATQLASEEDSFNNQYDADAKNSIVVVNKEELEAALATGKDVVLTEDITGIEATTSAPYGNKTAFIHDGGVFDGNGNKIGMVTTGDNYVVMTKGGTIKNLEIDNGFRGIMIMDPTEDIIIDNVYIHGEVCYAVNTGEGDGTKSLIVTNSTLNGWTSIGNAAVKDATFTNCTFGQGTYYTNVYGRLVKPYVSTVFENCEFDSKFYIDLSKLGKDNSGNLIDPTTKIVLKNCTVNGVLLTMDNIAELIAPEDTCGEGQITIEARDGSYLTAANWADYVIIE